MISLPDKAEAARARVFLIETGYTEEALRDAIGTSGPPSQSEVSTVLHLSAEVNARNILVRLFLIGSELSHDIVDGVIPNWFLDFCVSSKLLTRTADTWRANIVLVALDDFLIASDAFRVLDSADAAEFVLPASTHSANYLRQLIIPINADKALDLGTGCGIHALFASMHCKKVTASDISERATSFCKFNALLNGRENIRCVTGDSFSAVADEKFDLIFSNPPFVPGPAAEFTYRDNKLELDEFCQQLTAEAAGHLTDGGFLQMLCEWVEIDGQLWQDRIQQWTRDCGCDTWILHSQPLVPTIYVAKRQSDIKAGSLPSTDSYEDWVRYFTDRRVTGIHPGMIVLRKRAGANWFHSHDLASELTGSAGKAVLRGIAACDFLDQHDDQALLDSRLMLSPHLKLEQSYARSDGLWQPATAVLSMTDGMPMEAEIDLPVMAFLNQLDGSRSVSESITRFAEAANADEDKIRGEFIPIVQLFVGRGFVVPAG